MNQEKVNEEVQKKISNGIYYPRGHKLRYSQAKNGEFLLGLEAIALLSYDMGKGAINMSGSVLSKFKNLYTKTFKNPIKTNGTIITNPITSKSNGTKSNGVKNNKVNGNKSNGVKNNKVNRTKSNGVKTNKVNGTKSNKIKNM